MKNFYNLKVLKVIALTNDSVCIQLDTSNIDNGVFDFIAGQYITVKHIINEEEIRRSYSISSAPGEMIEIGVRLVQGGLMSTYLTKELQEGDMLDIMPPTGNFVLETKKDREKHYMAICAGSGITPVLSMIKDVLRNEPNSSFTLLYGNKNRSSIMFSNELLDLEQEFQSQLLVYYVFSREDVVNCIKGRINTENLEQLFQENKNLESVDAYFLCGPSQMIDNVKQFLTERNVLGENISFELFTTIDLASKKQDVSGNEILSSVSVCVDGDDFNFSLSSNGSSILDAAMQEGADVPFSCKGGVCCVCKAKVISGSVTMDQNFSLSEEEIANGFILTCQSHPASEEVQIDFDEI